MELWTGVLSWWKCHWTDLKSAGLFRQIPFLNSLKTSKVTLNLTLILWPINSGVLTSLFLPQLSLSLTDSLPSLNLLYHSKADAWFTQDAPKAVWSIPYVSVAFFPSLKHNFIAYRFFKRQIAFLKFNSCDNQALVGCIRIPAVAVHLNQKS